MTAERPLGSGAVARTVAAAGFRGRVDPSAPTGAHPAAPTCPTLRSHAPQAPPAWPPLFIGSRTAVSARRRYRPGDGAAARYRPGAAWIAGALALIAAGCGTGQAPPPGAGAHGTVTLAYAACMRAHGVPDFPDPKGSGPMTRQSHNGHLVIDGVTLKEDTARFQTAQLACHQYLAGGPGAQPSQRVRQQAEAFARCMRGHGLPNFPDPTFHHGVLFNTPPGFDPKSPRAVAAQSACQSLMPRAGVAGGSAG